MIDETPTIRFPLSSSDNSAVIELPERLTILEAVPFKQAISHLLNSDVSPQQVTLNFGKTIFIDSSGIGALVVSLKSAKEKNVKLTLDSVQPPVMATLSMTGLVDIFDISSSEKWSVKQSPSTHPSVRSPIKRVIDIVGSIVGLVITGIIFVPIAVAIKLDSPGPIFFSQTRCGWMGKKFQMWKFRSMQANAEEMKQKVENQASGAFFKNDNDPRVTSIGNFLRRTSLDEFPQFFNVLKGDMSLVGTRPPTEAEVNCYQVPEWQRLDVKPGMTGEWQVNGRSQVRNFEDVIKLDLKYQHNWNLSYDFKLIFKTILIIFNKNSGAV
ncbi:MAG: sugar transferase [Cyanobacteria bacterium P01_G01_bin.19]